MRRTLVGPASFTCLSLKLNIAVRDMAYWDWLGLIICPSQWSRAKISINGEGKMNENIIKEAEKSSQADTHIHTKTSP